MGLGIKDIEGIGPSYAEKLLVADIKTSDDLLEKGRTSKDRKNLAETTGISPKLILEWVNLADLVRVKGIGEEYSDLLEEAGVDTVVELSKRVPENLQKKMAEVNEEKHLCRRTPTLKEVENWKAQALELPRAVEY